MYLKHVYNVLSWAFTWLSLLNCEQIGLVPNIAKAHNVKFSRAND